MKFNTNSNMNFEIKISLKTLRQVKLNTVKSQAVGWSTASISAIIDLSKDVIFWFYLNFRHLLCVFCFSKYLLKCSSLMIFLSFTILHLTNTLLKGSKTFFLKSLLLLLSNHLLIS
jgi:hypothetical protein